MIHVVDRLENDVQHDLCRAEIRHVKELCILLINERSAAQEKAVARALAALDGSHSNTGLVVTTAISVILALISLAFAFWRH